MKKTRDTRKPVSAEAIARRADRGENVSRFFTNAGRMMPPIRQLLELTTHFQSPMIATVVQSQSRK